MSDFEARKEIIKSLDKNILIKASAGSGKTTILVERLVALIESGVPASEIVAVTFTKKAANEFYERLYRKLEKRSKDGFDIAKDDKYSLLENPTDEQKKRDRDALKEIDNIFLGTMDSFVQRILNEHPIEANVSSSSEIIDEDNLRVVLDKIYEELHRVELDDELKEALYYFDTYSHRASFVKFMNNFLEYHDYDFEMPPHSFDELTETIKEKVKNIKEGIITFKKYLDDLIITKWLTNADQRDSYEFFESRYEQIKNLDEEDLYSTINFLSSKKLQNLAFTYTNEEHVISSLNGFISTKTNRGKQYLNLSLYIKEVEELHYLASFMLPYLLKDSVNYSLTKQGYISFKEALRLVNVLLREDDGERIDIISSLKKRYKYFLIDESQDTDLSQYELFFRLTNKENIKDFKNGISEFPGALFIVGDKKQSIYHFKGADVSVYESIQDIFLKYEQEGKDYRVIELVNNFRSDAKLCEYFNDAFDNFLTNQGYEDIPEKESRISYAGAYLYDTDNPNNSKDIVTIVKELVNRGLYDYKDFMIIPFSKSRIADIARECSNAKIPYFSEGNISFDIDLIKSITSIFRYLIKPTSFNKYLVLSSPLFKIDISKPIDNEKEFLSGSILNIKETRGSIFLEKLISETECRDYLGNEGLDVLIGLIHHLKDAEEAGEITSLNECITYLDEVMNKNIIERFALIKKEVNAVQIANIHKVKGLQNKVVILPFAGSGERPIEKHVDLDNHKVEFFRFALDNDNNQAYKNPNLDEDDPELLYEKEYASLEKDRLLYVAATRAEHLLFIPNIVNGRGAQKWMPLMENLNLKHFKYPLGVKKEDVASKEETYFDPSFDTQKTIKKSSESSFRISNGSKTTYHKQDEEETFDDFYTVFDVEKEQKDFDPLLFGTLVHKLMEDILFRKEAKLPLEIVKEITQEYNAEAYEKILTNVYTTIYGGGYIQPEEDVPQDIYKFIKENEAYAEVPYSYKSLINGNEIINYGIIDLLVILKDEVMVIDYKTDDKEIDHTSQLNAYKFAVKKALGENTKVKAYIYHIKEDKRLEQ